MDNSQTGAGMNILAIETSQPHASLALSRNGEIVLQKHWLAERNHDAYLFPALQCALEMLGSSTPELILVGAGPGSYGGVRVALAAAVGVAQVTEAGIAAICSWCQLDEPGAVVVADARRGSWTVRKAGGDIQICTSEELRAIQADGSRILTVEPAAALREKGITPDKDSLIPTAAGLIETWGTMAATEQRRVLSMPPEPIYVRPPHITKPLHKPWEIRH